MGVFHAPIFLVFTHFAPRITKVGGFLWGRFWCMLVVTMSLSPAPLILIYGDSPQLNAVERQLRARPALQVIRIDPAGETATEQLAALREGVLLYDACAADPELITAIHTLHPRLVTLGLGGEDGTLALLGRAYPPAVVAGLGEVLAALGERSFPETGTKKRRRL